MGKRGSKKTKKIIKFPTYAKNGARYMEKRGYLVIPLERVPLPHGRAWRPPLRPVCDDGGGWAWGAPRTPPHLPPRRLAPLDHVSVDRDAQREPRLAKTRLKCEIWEKWGATYGRNGWVGENNLEVRERRATLTRAAVRPVRTRERCLDVDQLAADLFKRQPRVGSCAEPALSEPHEEEGADDECGHGRHELQVEVVPLQDLVHRLAQLKDPL